MSRPRPLDTLAMKATTTVYRRMLLMLRPLDDAIPEPSPKGRVSFREMAGAADRDAYLAMLPQRGRVVDERLRRGARCFLAWDGDDLAHGYWMAADRVRIDYLERDLVLGAGDVYTYDSYSPPAHRGRGLAQAVGLHAMAVARGEGRLRAFCLPAVENAAGIRPVEAIGYRRVAMLHCLRLGPYRRHWTDAWTDRHLPALAPTPPSGP